MSEETKITFRCPRCKSSQVVRDAYAEWNDDTQEWELQSTYDSFACNECGADFREPDEIELDDDDGTSQEAIMQDRMMNGCEPVEEPPGEER